MNYMGLLEHIENWACQNPVVNYGYFPVQLLFFGYTTVDT